MPTPLQEYTRISRYAAYNKINHRRETWAEQSTRVINQHRTFYAEKYLSSKELRAFFSEAEEAFLEQRVLGSQRALQFGGDPILKKHARLYNCVTSYADRPRFFQEAMWLLLCGCGVGFSVQQHHVAKLPKLVDSDQLPYCTAESITYQIPDSIEGWADAIGVLISSCLVDGPYPEYLNKRVEFDYSLIRPKGSALSSGNKAPGPDGLRTALELIRNLLYTAIGNRQEKLKPIQVYDIVMHLSGAVLSGGVRRSATIALFSKEDDEMMNAKTGNWFQENPQRSRSNNSCLLLRNETTWEEYWSLVQKNKEWGEPGVVWADSLESMFNPCCEINQLPSLFWENQWLSGWQGCNLSTINATLCKTAEDFYKACRAAAIIGTLQAGYTKFDYLGWVSEEITKREALLGVSITGIMDNPQLLLNPEVLRHGAEIVKQINKEVAALIDINPAARTTAVKPEGTTSCLLDTASGIHPRHAKRYFKLVQDAAQENPIRYFETLNPDFVEESVWHKDGGTKVIKFLVEAPEGAIVKNDISAVDLLKHVLTVQKNWIEPGRNLELCTQPWLQHNVSNTISMNPDEWEPAARFIYDNRQYFAGVAMLSNSGDLDYPQAPFQAVPYPEDLTPEFIAANEKYMPQHIANIAEWNYLKDQFFEIDWSLLDEEEFERNYEPGAACAGGKCEI